MPVAEASNTLYNSKLKQWRVNRTQLIADKNGISISEELIKPHGETTEYEFMKTSGVCKAKLNIQQFNEKNRTVSYKFIIKCNRMNDDIRLVSAELLQPTGNIFKILDPNGLLLENESVKLNSKSNYFIIVQFILPEAGIGTFEVPIVFNFRMDDDNKLFTIARDIVVEISEYIGHATKAEIGDLFTFTPLKWPAHAKIKYSKRGRLHYRYTIPSDLRKILETNCQKPDLENLVAKGDNVELLEQMKKVMKNGIADYVEYFHLLLWFDEISHAVALNKYNMSQVVVNVNAATKNLELNIPGLKEKRPSLIRGDRIQIRLIEPPANSAEEDIIYQGTINKIRSNWIKIGSFHQELFERIGRKMTVKCDVRLVLGRLPYERMHSSVEKCVSKGLLTTLFPDPKKIKPYDNKQEINNLCFINKEIESNIEQKTAVLNIVNGTSMEAPFIVFGPPGTGKTVTMVEAILQIKKHRKRAKILVCAPANDACDMLALKLQPHCTKEELIRVNSESRETELPAALKGYSNYDGKEYRKVSKDLLARHGIIVSTLVFIAGFLEKYRPDIIFIDEASHASEPEMTCAIALLTLGKQLVLAGDPKQLGPICLSNFAKPKLDVSLLERLMTTNDLYKNNDPRFLVMLKQNFRSHPTILKLPNDLFYGSQLTAVSRPAMEDPIAKIFIYPLIYSKKLVVGEAVEFCAISGKEKKNGISPSFFNELEVESVIGYVRALMSLNQTLELKISEEDIGIVTPYKNQAYRVKQFLEDKQWPNIEVGTVETFQGREKRIIIVTTVRAQTSLVLQDKDYRLGFVKDDKRFNVALTRATSKLIVIGCPSVLSTDKKWDSYMKFCQEKKAYFGIPYASRTDQSTESMLKAFQMMEFNG